MLRRNLQTALLGILVLTIVLSSVIAAFLVYSDNARFVRACIESKYQQGSNVLSERSVSEAAQTVGNRLCLKDISVVVANTIGTAFGPLLVIMLSVIFMHKAVKDDTLDVSQSRIALSIFTLLQILAVMILSWSVALTPNLLDLRPDALQNAIFTAVQGIIVAFVFPRGADAGT